MSSKKIYRTHIVIIGFIHYTLVHNVIWSVVVVACSLQSNILTCHIINIKNKYTY